MSEEVSLAAANLAAMDRLALQLDATRADLAAVEAAYEARAIERVCYAARKRPVCPRVQSLHGL